MSRLDPSKPMTGDQVGAWMSDIGKRAEKDGVKYATAIRELDARIAKGEEVIARNIDAAAEVDRLVALRDKLQALKDERAELYRNWAAPAFVLAVAYHLATAAKRLNWPIKGEATATFKLPGIIEFTLQFDDSEIPF